MRIQGGRALIPWIAPACLLIGAFLFFWPLLTGAHLVPFHVLAGDPALEGIDLSADRPDWRTYDLAPVTTFYAEKALAAHVLRSGELPLWNPYNALGVPLLADGQSQPFAPFFLPFLVQPTPWVYSFCLVLQILWGGLGMTIFLRRLGLGGSTQAFGTLLFAFNPYLLNYAVYSNAWTFVWFPWILWAFEGFSQDRSRWIPPSVVVALMGMSGHVEDAFFGATAFCVYGLVRHLQQRNEAATQGTWVIVPATSLGLSAWWVLPFLEYIRHASSSRFAASTPFPYHPSACFTPGSEIYWSPVLILLAATGWCARRNRRVAWAILPAVLWGVAMMFPWPLCIQRAATFDFASGRYGRSLVWTGLIVWAALGVDGLMKGEVGKRSRWISAAVAAGWWGVGFLAVAPSQQDLLAGRMVPLTGSKAPILGLVTAFCLLAILLAAGGAGRRVAPGTLAMALTSLAVVSEVFVHPGLDVCWNRSKPRLATLVSQRASHESGRMWFPDKGLWRSLPPNLSALWGIRDVRYCAPVVPRRLALLDPQKDPLKDHFGAWEPERAAFLGVSTAWQLDRGKGGLVLYEAEGQAPRAFWVGRSEAVATPEEGAVRALKGAAWKDEVFIEGPVPSGPRNGDPAARGTAMPIEDQTTRSRWRVEGPTAGWFVLRDLYFPGWKALVDGRPAPACAADGVFRAVPLGAGLHEVVFQYRPVSFFLGASLTLLTLVGLAAVWARGKYSRHGSVP
jgi:hypothetical protein